MRRWKVVLAASKTREKLRPVNRNCDGNQIERGVALVSKRQKTEVQQGLRKSASFKLQFL